MLQWSRRLSPRCILIGLQCPLCGSPVVRVSEGDGSDRLICPICWAAGNSTDVMEGRAKLARGTRIDGPLRVLVDRARFPKPPAAAADGTRLAGSLSAEGEAADLAAAAASQARAKASPERG